MFRRNVTRVVKYGLYGSVAIGGGAFVTSIYPDGDYDSLPIVRHTRAARTALEIGQMYKSMLYSKDWDRTSEEYMKVRSEAHKMGAEKLLELCKSNKGVYIKVGQHVGALEYLLPTEYVSTMKVLHKDAPKNTIEELFKVLKDDLNQDPTEIFVEFDPEPLGTASLAQVHRARLKDGTEVAVKVQHSYVRKNTTIDLRWMEILIKIMSKVFPDFQMQWLVDETKKNITKELNFLEEGKNAEKVAELFKNYTWLKVPKIFWEYCTERVLVMEYLTGGQVNDLKYIDSHNISRTDLCTKLGDLYSHMIFVTGFVHSDPHPGNIIIKKEPGDKEVTVCLLDHGLYAQLTDKFRYHYSKLWLAIIARDKEAIKFYSGKLGINDDLYALFACMVAGRPWDVIMKGIDVTKPSAAEKVTFQNELPYFLHRVSQCLEYVDRQALLVMKTNDLIRSIEYSLDMQDRMCGFMVMTKCCNESIYQLEIINEKSQIKRHLLSIRYLWTLLLIYFHSIYLTVREKLNMIIYHTSCCASV